MCSDENERNAAWREAPNFGEPVLREIGERGRRDGGEAEKEYVAGWIAEWSERIKVILTTTMTRV